MTKSDHFDSVQTENKVLVLSNVISSCMIANNMTVAVLDEACDVVKEVYRKNATMKKISEKEVV